tara:strand:- start:1346 stop:1537 length:192 start_codon:yes stop_codon:yes gene_type:complete
MILEKIWARALGHYMGKTDDDMPEIPIVTLNEAKIVLILKTMWVILQITTCLFIIANVIKHWR